jgi:uncharacterized protein YwgA
LELLSRIRGASDTDNIKIDQEGLKKEIAKNIDVLGEEQFLEILSQTSIFKEVFAEDKEESQKNIDLEEATVAN